MYTHAHIVQESQAVRKSSRNRQSHRLSEREGIRVRDVSIGMCTEWGVWAFLYHINRVDLIATCLCVKRTVHLPA